MLLAVLAVSCSFGFPEGYRQVLEKIHAPEFPDAVYDVLDAGVSADGKTDCREIVNGLIVECSRNGGGVVRFPEGEYFVGGSIFLKSNVNLHFSEGAVVNFSSDPKDYLPVVLSVFEGTEIYNYSAPIYARNCNNIAVTGCGLLNGCAAEGFAEMRPQRSPQQDILRQMGIDGVPANERCWGEESVFPPGMMEFVSCNGILIEGISIIDAPFWTIHPIYCDNVTVRGVTIKSDNLNNDGCDPEFSTNVLIENCDFDCLDDAIAIKAGRDQDAWKHGRPTSGVIVRNCTFASRCNGICIGSEMSAGVENVYMHDIVIRDCVDAIYFKSNRDRGGFIRNVWVDNVVIEHAKNAAIRFSTDYHGARGGFYPAIFENFHISDVTSASSGKFGVWAVGIPGYEMRNIFLENIDIQGAAQPYRIKDAFVRFKNVIINGKHQESPSPDAPAAVIPQPQEVVLDEGFCEIVPALASARAEVVIDKSVGPSESYRLEITRNDIRITASDEDGAFYAKETLKQLVQTEGYRLRCMEIYDAPRYAYRGFMLDEARHFFGEEKVKRILDLMARYKLNTFHWHLTDSQGWRMEIKKYPRLTEIGAKGDYSNEGEGPAQYYTQEQMASIVDYASKLHIDVIPEVDMPGHANASNRAYPEYSGGMTVKYGEFTYNPGYEGTYRYLTDIIGEVKTIFPDDRLHIGGDEVWFGIAAWNDKPEVQKLMAEKGFTELRQVEKYFIERMMDSLAVRGIDPLGWDELTEIGAPLNTDVYWWRHNKPEVLADALDKGYHVILCPRIPCYFDFIQHEGLSRGRTWNGEFCPLDKCYGFPENILDDMNLPEASLDNIKGLQANLWTERVPAEDRLDYMVWPRLCAVAESAWTLPSNKDYDDFQSRLNYSYKYFDALGIHCFDHRNPSRRAEPSDVKGSCRASFRLSYEK